MMPLRIVYNDQAKLQTVLASSEVTQYPALNAVHPHLSRVWRTTSAATQWIKFDAGVGKTVAFDTACIVGHNLTSAAVVWVQSDDADAWAPPGGVDKSGDPTQPLIIVDTGVGSTARRYVRVYIDDPANPAGYLQIGRVFLSTRFEGETIDRGFRIGIEDSTAVSRSLTGQLFADIGIQQRVYSLSLGTMCSATKAALLAVLQSCGQYDPVIVIPAEAAVAGDAAAGIAPLYACMSKQVSFTEAGGWGWTDDTVEVREAK